MCFLVSVPKTQIFRKRTKWIRCHKRLIWMNLGGGWIWSGGTYPPLQSWAFERMHVPVRTDIDSLKVETNGVMENEHGLYIFSGRYKNERKGLPKLRPTSIPRQVEIYVAAWVHPKDVLAVSWASDCDGLSAVKAKRVWLGNKPPTKKQLKEKPITI